MTYVYDAAGRLTTKTLPGASRRSYVYDPLGRPITIVGPDGRIDYRWDDANRLIAQRCRGDDRLDAARRVARVRLRRQRSRDLRCRAVAGTIGYRYDDRGRLAAVDRPGGGTFEFGYDELDRVVTLTDPTASTTS